MLNSTNIHAVLPLQDVYVACQRFKDLGVPFKKSPNSGGMKGLAFIYDPDGYAIEIIAQGSGAGVPSNAVDCFGIDLQGQGGTVPPYEPAAAVDLSAGGGTLMDVSSYYQAATPSECAGWVMQQTMLRVKDPQVSLPFYQDVLGMTLVKRLDFQQWGFSLFFMGYLPDGMSASDLPPDDSPERMDFLWSLPATVELTHNHGSEAQEGVVYHTGNSYNDVTGGFGHIGITVPNVYDACDRFHELGVEFKKSPNSGGMKGLAFIKDPDGYWIEVHVHYFVFFCSKKPLAMIVETFPTILCDQAADFYVRSAGHQPRTAETKQGSRLSRGPYRWWRRLHRRRRRGVQVGNSKGTGRGFRWVIDDQASGFSSGCI